MKHLIILCSIIFFSLNSYAKGKPSKTVSDNTPTSIGTFGDWNLFCEKVQGPADPKKSKSANSSKVCYLQQVINSSDDGDKNKSTTAAIYRFYYNDKKFNISLILPLGVDLLSGTAVIADKKLLCEGKFIRCMATGCISSSESNKDSISTILKSKEAHVTYAVFQKQYTMPFSPKGLKDGLEKLSKY